MTLDRLNGVVVDCETGGLNAASCALLEVALVAVEKGRPFMSWHTRVRAHSDLRIEAEAASVNGWTPGWGGVEEAYALFVVCDFLRATQEKLKRKQILWIGANTPFDRAFLAAAGLRHGHDPLAAFSHRDVDVARMAMVPFLMGEVRGVGIDSLRKSLLGKEERQGSHTALSDCMDALDCLRAIMGRLTWREAA
jgi:DNA polymerase III epsilon subunit-like protein